jgi:hypothetical protein
MFPWSLLVGKAPASGALDHRVLEELGLSECENVMKPFPFNHLPLGTEG